MVAGLALAVVNVIVVGKNHGCKNKTEIKKAYIRDRSHGLRGRKDTTSYNRAGKS